MGARIRYRVSCDFKGCAEGSDFARPVDRLTLSSIQWSAQVIGAQVQLFCRDHSEAFRGFVGYTLRATDEEVAIYLSESFAPTEMDS